MSSINQLKSLIGKRGGLAPGNRFAVYMPLPLINLDLQEIVARAFDQGANVSGNRGFVNDPRDVSILCESATIPGRQIYTTELANNPLLIKMPYAYSNDDVSFTFRITNDHFMKKFFESWSKNIMNHKNYTLKYRNQYTTDVMIQQLDQRNKPMYTVSLKKAYPIQIQAYDVSDAHENYHQRLTVTLTYEDWAEEGFVEQLLTKGKIALGSIGKTLPF